MPRCADAACGRWRPERLAPRWAMGLRFNGAWYCSRVCVQHAARHVLDAELPASPRVGGLPPMRLGVLLRHLGGLSEATVADALEAQARTGRRIGEELASQGLVERDIVLRALAAQAGTSYLTALDLSRVRSGPSWLGPGTVRALGLVPFEVLERRRQLRVVCTAPVPRASLRALARLTGWTAEPYLVHEDVFAAALAAYRPSPPAGTDVREAVRLPDLSAAAARIADAAAEVRTITARHASCSDCTWVRVEGPHHLSDMLVYGAGEAR